MTRLRFLKEVAWILGVVAMLGLWIRHSHAQTCDPHWIQEPKFTGYFFEGVSPRISTMAEYDDGSGPALYVCGDFSTINDDPINSFAKWDGVKWESLGTFDPQPKGSLAVFDDGGGSALYIGGTQLSRWNGQSLENSSLFLNSQLKSFGTLATFDDGSGASLYFNARYLTGPSQQHLFKWDGKNLTVLGDGVFYGSTAFDNGDGMALYLGGEITINGITASRVVRWDGATFQAVGPTFNSRIYALESYNDGSGLHLYAGGQFTSIGGEGAARLAMWNETSWSQVGTGITDFDGYVYSLKTFDDGSGQKLYVAGDFILYVVPGASCWNITRWNGTSFDLMDYGMDKPARCLAQFHQDGQERLCIGGEFDSAFGPSGFHSYGAIWSGLQWRAFGEGLNGPVEGFATYTDTTGTRLAVSGRFGSAGDVSLHQLALWDGKAWQSLPDPQGNGTSAILSVPDPSDGIDDLYLGGKVPNSFGGHSPGILVWRDGSHWESLGNGFDDIAYSIAQFDDGAGPAIYAAGSFTNTSDGIPLGPLAKWDGSQWIGVDPASSGNIETMQAFDDGSGMKLYVAGFLNNAGMPQSRYLARWTGSKWEGLGDPTGYAGVHDFLVFDDGNGPALYAGGRIRINQQNLDGVFRWNGNAWSVVGSPFTQGVVYGIGAFDDDGVNGSSLFATGAFLSVQIADVNGMLKFDGDAWQPMGLGLSGTASGTTTARGYSLLGCDAPGLRGLYVGGDFSKVNGFVSYGIGRWGCDVSVSCPSDISPLGGDGTVNISDLTEVILAWGTSGPTGDVNGDSVVNIQDLTAVILAWGACP